MSHSWPMVPLGEVLKPVSRPEPVDPEKTYRILGAHWYAHGLYTKDTLLGSEIRADKVFRVEEGDFVYNRLFAWKGSFAVATEENDGCYVSNEFPCFVLKRDRADGNYLWRYFSRASAWDDALELSTGGTPTSRNRLKEEKFLAIKIPLPPLPAQRRIVARIDELAAKIEEARSLRQHAAQKTEVLALHVAADLFPTPGDSVVKDYVHFQTGYAFKSEWFIEEGIRLVRNANVEHGCLDWSETVRIPEERCPEFSRFELKAGDVLISLDRPIISTGVKVAQVKEQDLPCLLLQRVARAQFHTGEVLPDYFFRWLRSSHFINAIDPGRSNGVPHISHKDIENIPFIPPSLRDQRRIVAELDASQTQVEVLKRLQAETGAELDAILPSILDKAFKGQLA